MTSFLPRFTLRRALIAVALLALFLVVEARQGAS